MDVEVQSWSAAARSVWGKTGVPDVAGVRGSALALVQHLEDTAGVAGVVWDEWLPGHVLDLLSEDLAGGRREGRLRLQWLAGLHDIGKSAPGFAVKAAMVEGGDMLLADMATHGLTSRPAPTGPGQKLPPHCRIGMDLLRRWLIENTGARGRAATALAGPVGMHHGTPPTRGELQGLSGSEWTGRDNPSWRAVQDEIMAGMTARLGVTRERLTAWASLPPTLPQQVLLTAAIVVADWLASDTARFPHEGPFDPALRLEDAQLREALVGRWQPPGEVADAGVQLGLRFPRLAGRSITALQRAARDLAARADEPSLLIIEAPMGAGKTEAALLAAEEFARRFGLGGVFVGLPTMATSDAMFSRVREWTENLGGSGRSTMFLAHSKAHLNRDYEVLLHRSAASARENDIGQHTVNQAEEGPSAPAVVGTWLRGRRKGLLASFVVGTIDQALFGALKARHVALRHLGLVGKVVVIDEVHAADVYMRSYLERALGWLGAYRVPVVLLSATLPSEQRRQLLNAYAKGRDKKSGVSIDSWGGYPRLTMQADATEEVSVEASGDGAGIEVSAIADDLERLTDRVRALADQGACVVIIRNTVARAQETYRAIAGAVGRERSMLLHSQFAAAHRARQERELLQLLGPEGPNVERPHGYVVVGTQVLEQSLDIDADVMVTDLAPVDLVLQRAGRLHRHQRGEGQSGRPQAVRSAQLAIVGVPIADAEARLEPGAAVIYGERALLASAHVLRPHVEGRPIALPLDIPRLVEAAYTDALEPPTAWAGAWQRAEEEARHEARSAEDRASTFRLGLPTASTSLVGWLEGSTDDPATNDEALAGRAQVRDGEDSLEVLLVRRGEDGLVRLLDEVGDDGGAVLGVPELGPPPRRLERALLSSSIRLPRRLTAAYRIDAVIEELEKRGGAFDGWQQSPWLAGQLVLELDDEGRTTLGGVNLRYDPDMGLVMEGKEEGR